jgi:hypothetical protein
MRACRDGQGCQGSQRKIVVLACAILVGAGGCSGGGSQVDGARDGGVTRADGGVSPKPSDAGTDVVDTASGGGDAVAGGGDAATPCPGDPYDQICEADGWCWKNPLPQGNDVSAVWVPSSGEIWGAVGGAILRRSRDDGWSKMPTDTEISNASLWGADAANIWAAGAGADSSIGFIVRWDGTRWTEVNQTNGVVLGFSDIDGKDAGEVWAVGGQTVMHFDGAAWTAMDLTGVVPSESTSNTRVAVAAHDNVWVAMGRRLLRWDGVSWSFEDLPMFITDIWTADRNTAYRALSANFSGTAEIQRWDGGAWGPSLVVDSPPEAAGGPFEIRRVGGSGAGDVWALDSLGTTYHFDGAVWSTKSTGAPFLALDLWADTPGSAVVVGRQGEIREFVNGAWERQTSGVPASIRSIWGTGRDDIWFGGGVIPPATAVEPALLHWDGSQIGAVALPAGSASVTAVWAIGPGAGAGAGAVWVGGQNGFLARRVGATWQTFSVTPSTIQEIWGAAGDDVWMSDAAGAAFHWDGRDWSPVTVTLSFVFDIHGTATDDVWMVGSGGAAHWDGSAWSQVPLEDTTGGISSVRVWATAPDDVWIRTVTFQTTTEIRHFDGIRFDIVPLPFFGAIDDIWSPGPGELYVGGDSVLHFHDGRWEIVGPQLPHLWGVAGNFLWGAGNGGTIMRLLLPGGSACPVSSAPRATLRR